VDPNPGGPKTCGSGGSGSGSATLIRWESGSFWPGQIRFFLTQKSRKFEAILTFKSKILPSQKLTLKILLFSPCKVLGTDLEQIILDTYTTKDKSLWKFLSYLILRTFWVNISLLAISHQSSERSLAASSALVVRASDQ
jgi:hypothetical protein